MRKPISICCQKHNPRVSKFQIFPIILHYKYSKNLDLIKKKHETHHEIGSNFTRSGVRHPDESDVFGVGPCLNPHWANLNVESKCCLYSELSLWCIKFKIMMTSEELDSASKYQIIELT